MQTEDISMEKCLNMVSNKFELALFVMNRAKRLLLGGIQGVETTKNIKKSVNIAMCELVNNRLDLVDLRQRIKKSLLINNMFLKSLKNENNIEDDANISADDNINILDMDVSETSVAGEVEDDLALEEDDIEGDFDDVIEE